MIAIAVVTALGCQAQTTESGDSVYVSRVQSRRYLQGCKAFFEAGYLWELRSPDEGVNIFDYYRQNKFSVSVSGGYQFNNYVFAGMGIAADVYSSSKNTYVCAPIFVEGRANFVNNRRFTPFLDVRAGYGVGDISGFYGAIQLGVRYKLPKKRAVYLTWCFDFQYNDSNNSQKADAAMNNMGLKIGFEL